MFTAVDFATVLLIVFGLMLITNMVVQVLKKVTWEKIPTNFLVFLVAFILSFAAMFLFLSYKGIAVTWVPIVVTVVLWFAVSYSSMFGFDKFKEGLESWIALRDGTKRE